MKTPDYKNSFLNAPPDVDEWELAQQKTREMNEAVSRLPFLFHWLIGTVITLIAFCVEGGFLVIFQAPGIHLLGAVFFGIIPGILSMFLSATLPQPYRRLALWWQDKKPLWLY